MACLRWEFYCGRVARHDNRGSRLSAHQEEDDDSARLENHPRTANTSRAAVRILVKNTHIVELLATSAKNECECLLRRF